MEPASIIVVAATYTGSLVAKTFANDAVTASWDKLKKYLKNYVKPSSDSEPPQSAEIGASGADQDAELVEVAKAVVDSTPALRRATLNEAAIAGSRILWVDDNPAWNSNERGVLEGFGAVVVSVDATPVALSLLGSDTFDLVLSDMSRDGNPKEGLVFFKAIGSKGLKVPVVYYVGAVDHARGRPVGSAGITDHPDELLHLVLDVLERSRL